MSQVRVFFFNSCPTCFINIAKETEGTPSLQIIRLCPSSRFWSETEIAGSLNFVLKSVRIDCDSTSLVKRGVLQISVSK